MSVGLFQLHIDDDLGEEIDYEEIDWDEFANLDLIHDLSDDEDDYEEDYIKIQVVKALPTINLETQALMDTYKYMLKWVNHKNDNPPVEYSENDYPDLSSKIDIKKHSKKFKRALKFKKLSPPILFDEPSGINFKVDDSIEIINSESDTPIKNNEPLNLNLNEHSIPQPLMAIQTNSPPRNKVLNKLCFTFFKKTKCTKPSCVYAHSIKEVDLNALECKSFSKNGTCPLVETVGLSKQKKIRYLKNLEGSRICYGRHSYNGYKESVHSYISRTTKQFDVIKLAKQIKASQDANKKTL